MPEPTYTEYVTLRKSDDPPPPSPQQDDTRFYADSDGVLRSMQSDGTDAAVGGGGGGSMPAYIESVEPFEDYWLGDVIETTPGKSLLVDITNMLAAELADNMPFYLGAVTRDSPDAPWSFLGYPNYLEWAWMYGYPAIAWTQDQAWFPSHRSLYLPATTPARAETRYFAWVGEGGAASLDIPVGDSTITISPSNGGGTGVATSFWNLVAVEIIAPETPNSRWDMQLYGNDDDSGFVLRAFLPTDDSGDLFMTATEFAAAVANLGILGATVSGGDGEDVMQALNPTPLTGGTSRDPAIAISFDLKVTR